MCGFVGFCDGRERDGQVKKEIARIMTDKISHRGPDEQGFYGDEFVTLGFCRLKIIDLRGGGQPMRSADGRYIICFNGEIYNYREQREELEKKHGIRFRSESDTEVLLYMCIVYGEKALEKLEGMFSFVFYDRQERKLLIARDPFGIKPLYYCSFGGCFMFASEIKALTVHPEFQKKFNEKILPLYLQFQYVPTEETAFCGVRRLLPGHLIRYCDGSYKVEKYFESSLYNGGKYRPSGFFPRFGDTEKGFSKTERNLIKMSETIFKAVKTSVKKHMVSDVEVAAFLSGGVDSGLINAFAGTEKVFTVGFTGEGFDERIYAMKNAEKTGGRLTSVEINADDFFGAVENVQYYSDEPCGNLSAVPLYLMSAKASEKVKVVLSGEGADELFGGYEWYEDSFAGKVYRLLPEGMRKRSAKSAPQGRTGDFIRRNSGSAVRDFIGQAKIMTFEQAELLLNHRYDKVDSDAYSITGGIYTKVPGASLLRKKMYLDFRLWMPYDILNKADKMTMANSLELRVPYLDLNVLRTAEKCHEKLLVKGKTTKYVLRTAAEKVLGRESAYRKKKGFPVPFRNWIREKKYAGYIEEALKCEACERYFDKELLHSMLDRHVKGIENNARVLYTVYAFLVWYKRYFETEPIKTAVYSDDDSSCDESVSGKEITADQI